jgi:hypothetical protein
MQDTGVTFAARSRIPARSVALPIEHGAWGFLLEPLLVGAVIAPSLGAPFISVLLIGAFLARHPLKFVIGDRLQGRSLPRTKLAEKYLAIFAAIAFFGLLGSLIVSPYALIPLAAVAPIAAYLINLDAARQTRELLPEILASVALSSSIAVLALAAGFGSAAAFSLWSIMIARLIPSVLYVRARLRLEKGKEFSRWPSAAAHMIAILLLLALYTNGLSSILTVAFAIFLLFRSIGGLSNLRRKLTAKQLGVREVIYGVIYALTVVIGYYASF